MIAQNRTILSICPRRTIHFSHVVLILCMALICGSGFAQIQEAQRTGFCWITTEDIQDESYGAGYSTYSAVFPILDQYPGAWNIQMGLGSAWMTTQATGNEPDGFYTTIEGGIGWWHDTRFATATPKFIMGGVSHNFHSWANGPGAGQTGMLNNGQRDWSQPGGKYGVAQLSNGLLWPPDGLNLKQGLDGELLGYGYQPLPLMDALEQTAGTDVQTGNQCWTLFFNTTNFKGPATFFLPTFWTEPVLEDPSIAGLFFDVRPSEPNVGFGIEHAITPAIISNDDAGTPYAKIDPIQFPVTEGEQTVIMDQIRVYSNAARWDDMEAWFAGGPADDPAMDADGIQAVGFVNDGGAIVGEISLAGAGFDEFPIDMEGYVETFSADEQTMGFVWDTDVVQQQDGMFVLPEYFRLDGNDQWQPISSDEVPASTQLLDAAVPYEPAPHITYVTPLEPDCQWQDPNSPWHVPGPAAGPYTADLGDGSTVTYYWYRFVDQPSIVNANLPESHRQQLQERVEMMHTAWNAEMEYLEPPLAGELAALDPGLLVQPPAGMEVGYVPIVTRQETSDQKVRVFVLAGQSNMEGFGEAEDASGINALPYVVANDSQGEWDMLGTPGNWTVRDDVWIHFDATEGLIQDNVTVGQGAYPHLIGPELMFAHELGDYFDDPVLIIKTAWGGKNLAVDFRPPSAGGQTGASYTEMLEVVEDVTSDLGQTFPDMGMTDFEVSGFVWFQGWNDGEEVAYLNEYESNLHHLVGDVRAAFDSPELPFVIASSGHGGVELHPDLWTQDMQLIVAPAQEAVGCDDEQYGGTVGFVDTKPFFLDLDESPEDALHHFHNNALTFLNIGRGMGEEMIRAIACEAFCLPLSVAEFPNSSVAVVYPNPTQGVVQLESRGERIEQIELLDLGGKRVQVWEGVHREAIELRLDQSPGVYVLRVTLHNGRRGTVTVLKGE